MTDKWNYEIDNADCSNFTWYNIYKADDDGRRFEAYEEKDAITLCAILNLFKVE